MNVLRALYRVDMVEPERFPLSELHQAAKRRMKNDPVQWARRFDLLSDPTRLRLLTHMHQHPNSPVGDLAEAAYITPTAASQALRVLRDQGWVNAKRDGRVMRYTLIDDTAHQLLHFIGDQH